MSNFPARSWLKACRAQARQSFVMETGSRACLTRTRSPNLCSGIQFARAIAKAHEVRRVHKVAMRHHNCRLHLAKVRGVWQH